MTEKPTMWTLSEALVTLRSIQMVSRAFGYHMCIGGGVVNEGSSKKDLDLYALPMDNDNQTKPDEFVEWLEKLWGGSTPISNSDSYPLPADSAYSHKVKFVNSSKRIDLFLMKGRG